MTSQNEPEAWEFLALYLEGPRYRYFLADFGIGGFQYPGAVIATGFPHFAMVHVSDFRDLADRKAITDVEKADDYIGRMVREAHQPTGEDDYALGLEPSVEEPGHVTPPISMLMNRRDLLEPYPFEVIGKADVAVKGRHERHTFCGVPVAGGDDTLIGLSLLKNLTEYTIGHTEDFGLAIHGFLRH